MVWTRLITQESVTRKLDNKSRESNYPSFNWPALLGMCIIPHDVAFFAGACFFRMYKETFGNKTHISTLKQSRQCE